jgi:hypothetical protein
VRLAWQRALRRPPADLDERVCEYWDWLSVALFLLVTVDALTTLYAARVAGTAAESNPVMRWAPEHGLPAVLALNLAAVVLVAVLFYGVVEMLRSTPAPVRPYFAVLVEVWIGGLLVAGLVVFANNVAVVVLGESLL